MYGHRRLDKGTKSISTEHKNNQLNFGFRYVTLHGYVSAGAYWYYTLTALMTP